MLKTPQRQLTKSDPRRRRKITHTRHIKQIRQIPHRRIRLSRHIRTRLTVLNTINLPHVPVEQRTSTSHTAKHLRLIRHRLISSKRQQIIHDLLHASPLRPLLPSLLRQRRISKSSHISGCHRLALKGIHNIRVCLIQRRHARPLKTRLSPQSRLSSIHTRSIRLIHRVDVRATNLQRIRLTRIPRIERDSLLDIRITLTTNTQERIIVLPIGLSQTVRCETRAGLLQSRTDSRRRKQTEY